MVFRPIRFFQCSTPTGNIRREPESSFGENQLLQRSVSFSLQPTSHPKMLHNLRVRPSHILSYMFSLLMGSSRCFGSNTYNLWSRYSHSLSLWLHPKGLSRAVRINSLAHSSIGTPWRTSHYSRYIHELHRGQEACALPHAPSGNVLN